MERAIHHAAKYGHTEAMRLLLEHGADTNVHDMVRDGGDAMFGID